MIKLLNDGSTGLVSTALGLITLTYSGFSHFI